MKEEKVAFENQQSQSCAKIEELEQSLFSFSKIVENQKEEIEQKRLSMTDFEGLLLSKNI